jgi:uncharacterized membrane protein YozB (DUF420 family)
MVAAVPAWERLIILAPAIVISIGLVFVVFLLLGRAFLQTVRESGHRRLIYAALAAVVVFVGVMTYLGVELPREGG